MDGKTWVKFITGVTLARIDILILKSASYIQIEQHKWGYKNEFIITLDACVPYAEMLYCQNMFITLCSFNCD